MLYTHKAGAPLGMIITLVTNPRSLRPTSTFKDMLFTGGGLFKVAEYTENIFLKTDYLGSIDMKTASIAQSDYAPNVNSTLTLSFFTNNPLPWSAAILLQVPQTLPILYESGPGDVTCSIRLNGDDVSTGSDGKQICDINTETSSITYNYAFNT